MTQELVERLGEASGLPVGLYIQAAGGTALANALVATRVGADVVATAVYPLALTLHRIAGESLVEVLEGLDRPTGVDVARLWDASDVVDEHLGDEPLAPLSPRIAVRAAEYDLPAGLVAALDVHLRAHAAGDRLARHAHRGRADPRRGRPSAARGADRPDPRIAGPAQRAVGASLRHGARRVPPARHGRVRDASG